MKSAERQRGSEGKRRSEGASGGTGGEGQDDKGRGSGHTQIRTHAHAPAHAHAHAHARTHARTQTSSTCSSFRCPSSPSAPCPCPSTSSGGILSIYLSISSLMYLCIYLSMYLSVYLKVLQCTTGGRASTFARARAHPQELMASPRRWHGLTDPRAPGRHGASLPGTGRGVHRRVGGGRDGYWPAWRQSCPRLSMGGLVWLRRRQARRVLAANRRTWRRSCPWAG